MAVNMEEKIEQVPVSDTKPAPVNDAKYDKFVNEIERTEDFQSLPDIEKQAFIKEWFKDPTDTGAKGGSGERVPLFTPTVSEKPRQHIMSGFVPIADEVMNNMDGLQQTAEELGLAGLEYVNTFAMGLPRRALREFTKFDVPEPRGMYGKGLRAVGATAGIIQSPATKLASFATRGIDGIGIGAGALKGGLEGAMLGAAYTSEEHADNIQQEMVRRGVTTAFGGVSGVVLGSIVGGIRGFINWRKTALSEDPTKPIDRQMKAVRQQSEKSLRKAQEHLVRYKDAVANKQLNVANREAVKMQDSLRTMLGDMTEEYGKRMGKAEKDFILKKGGEITQGELYDVLENTISEMRTAKLNSGTVATRINELASKHNIEIGGMADDGLPILNKNYDLRDTKLDFQSVIKDIRSATSRVTSSAQKGNARYTPDDIPASILKKNWYDYLGKYDDGIKTLNKEYATALRESYPLIRIVKPYKAEIEAGQMTNIINRVATAGDKANPIDLQVISAVENGNAFVKGGGKLTSESMKLGERTRMINERLGTTGIRGTLKTGSEARLNRKLAQLGFEKQQVEQIMRNKKVAAKLDAFIGGGLLITALSIAAKRWVSNKVLNMVDSSSQRSGNS